MHGERPSARPELLLLVLLVAMLAVLLATSPARADGSGTVTTGTYALDYEPEGSQAAVDIWTGQTGSPRDWTVAVELTATGPTPAYLTVQCDGDQLGGSGYALPAVVAEATVYSFTLREQITGPGVCRVQLDLMEYPGSSTVEVVGGSVTWADAAEAAGGGGCAEPCEVELVAADRALIAGTNDRLDLATFSVVVAGGLGLLTGSALVFGRLLRHG